MPHRPSFAAAWSNFATVNVPVAQVGVTIGGKVGQNIAAGIFTNACPIRMSYVLNRTGVPIPAQGYAVSSGADGRWYMFRVNDMMTFLERALGAPDKRSRGANAADFRGLRGISVVKGTGWSDARGHVTLWDGMRCSDHCHLAHDPDNGTFVPDEAALWVLA